MTIIVTDTLQPQFGSADAIEGHYNGLTFGLDGMVHVAAHTGLRDMPGVRRNPIARFASDGSIRGRHTHDDRVITFEWLIIEDTATDYDITRRIVAQACNIARTDDLPLVFTAADARIYCSPIRCDIPQDMGQHQRTGSVFVEFVASDPLIYSETEHAAITSRVVGGEGFLVPFTVPFTLGGSTSGLVDAANAGTAAAPWTARLDGPLTNPQIRHVESNRWLNFAANGGLDIGVGQWLDLSSKDESALLLGTADRTTNLTLDSDWFDLDPGPNTIEITASIGTGTMTFRWRDARWIL